MPRLISRQKSIPNGFVFYVSQTGWKAPKFASFQTIVNALIAHRKGNPHLTAKFKWSTNPETVAKEVDEFNANVCLRMGWLDYVQAAGGQPAVPPFQLRKAPILGKLERLAAGARVIVEWIKSGQEAVPAELAEARAAKCSGCPKNGKGDWTAYFTVPVSAEIRKALDARREWNLSTSHDEKLKVCEACYCPLPLKVHMPIERIVSRIDEESFKELVPDCWIRTEKPQAG